MNYDKIYKQIIEFRKENPLDKDLYGENHHIIPKSLGGSDAKENLVRLSAREHFICHMLLAEMYLKETFEWYKMNHAFIQMKASSSKQMRYINNRYYELKKKDLSITQSFSQSGSKNSNFGMIWIHSVDENKSIKIHKSLISDYLENGYEIGQKPKIKYVKLFNVITKKWRLVPTAEINKCLNSNVYLKQKPESKPRQLNEILVFNQVKYNSYIITRLNKVFSCNIKNINDLNLLFNDLTNLYHVQLKSLTEIAKMYNTSHNNILNYFKKMNIERRNISSALKNFSKLH